MDDLTRPHRQIYFSILQRKVLTPNDFASLQDLMQRLLAFSVTTNHRQTFRLAVHKKGSHCNATKVGLPYGQRGLENT
jgi:hypothetical protein